MASTVYCQRAAEITLLPTTAATTNKGDREGKKEKSFSARLSVMNILEQPGSKEAKGLDWKSTAAKVHSHPMVFAQV